MAAAGLTGHPPPNPPLPDPRWRLVVSHVAGVVRPLGMVLYGSRAGGLPRADSDWDVLAVVDDVDQVRIGGAVCGRVREASGLPVDLILATPRGLGLRLLVDPHIRFCLATGIRLGGVPDVVMPLSRQGALDSVLAVRLELEDADDFSERDRAQWQRRVAKEIAVLEMDIGGEFDPMAYAVRVRELTTGPVGRREKAMWEAVERLQETADRMTPNAADEALVAFLKAISARKLSGGMERDGLPGDAAAR